MVRKPGQSRRHLRRIATALAVFFLIPAPLAWGKAAEIARAIRENSFDRNECYRIRDITLVREDIRIYLADGHIIFSKPVAGRRIAAVFTADVEGGDGEVILMPPNLAERTSLASYIASPNLNEHFRSALFLFTGNDYDQLISQFPQNPTNKKAPELGPVMEEEWTPALRNLGTSYLTRLTLDLLGGPGRRTGLFAALFANTKRGNFDIVYDPESIEQIFGGQLAMRENRLYFDTWTSFVARSLRQSPPLPKNELLVSDYRIEATVEPDLTLSVVTRAKVRSTVDGLIAAPFDVTPDMEISAVTVDGKPAEVLERESLRINLTRGGNNLFLVEPPEPLRAGRDYEFEFRHSGKVILDAGDRVFYVRARGNWYPLHGAQFADYDLRFRYPRDLDLVSAGDVVEDRTEGEWRITRRRTPAPIRLAAFNLGNYAHAREERGSYTVDVYANRALEKALQPKPQLALDPAPPPMPRRRPSETLSRTIITPPPPDPLERLHTLASEVASALEFMASKFGPPALPRLTVSPIPGTFGQGFPGLIYLSTLSYLKHLPRVNTGIGESQEMFYSELLQSHETAHQWWGNRITSASYRDYWLMEALANYSSLLYLEKVKGIRAAESVLDTYRSNLLLKNQAGATIESTGPIVLGPRLESSQEPRAWRNITYGKGSWILQMLRRRMGDERFFSMLAELIKHYDHQEISTETFRLHAAQFLPPKSPDPGLESFFEQWVYGTGIPTLRLSYAVKGKAPSWKLVGTLTQSDAGEDFSALVPVEVQTGRGRTITHWVRSANEPVTFTVSLPQQPLKVTLDPRHAVLRRP
jgi:hypothetical protein